MTMTNKTVRLKVSPEVARVAGQNVPHDVRLKAAQGALPFSPVDRVAALFFLVHGSDGEVRAEALKTFQRLDSSLLAPVAADPGLHPRLLDFVARVRLKDETVMAALLANPAFPEATLVQVAAHARGKILDLFAGLGDQLKKSPALLAALLGNPQLPPDLRSLLDESTGTGERSDTKSEAPKPEQESDSVVAEAQEEEKSSEEPCEEEEKGELSKYQRALEMGVSGKIKMALTGDKEWRGIFLKDSNKLVSAAVLKNPRITEGEVLAVAKNKSSSEELIRLITMNNDWIKNLEIKKALIYHPKTPLPKALRYLGILNEKDLKQLGKSRGVSQVLVNSARRMLTAKQKKK